MKNRIVAIDTLRGFALLGILLMNMASFAMPSMAYYNPTVYGGDDIWNRMVFSFSYIFADQKMMGLFSMLFGASVMLVTTNMEKKGQNPLWFHYIRNFWLLIIGLIHATFIWEGDILMIYAACSFVLYWFRKMSPKWQLGIGLFVFFIPALLNLGITAVSPTFTAEDTAYIETSWQPSADDIANELALYRGNYGDWIDDSWESSGATLAAELIDLSFMVEFFARAFGMMLVGMAFYSWGILTAKKSPDFYKKMAWIGFGIGLPMAILSLSLYSINGWDALYSTFNGRIPNHIATPFVASGYIALIMLWSKSSLAVNLQNRFAAVGRMALTNYIGQSLIGTTIFYGFGFGLFGYLDRVQQLGIIGLIWVFQLLFSTWWLNRFQYGPLEWVWRILSHRRWQPLQKKQAAQVVH
ncbi:MAG: DUF418 domain-containing protein [Chloroflexota bacterium]